MKVEIFSDVVCPWCYIGHTRFRAAVRAYGKPVQVAYRPFQLSPESVSDGTPLTTWLEGRFGRQALQMIDRVVGVAAEDGLDLKYDKAIGANTLEAHRLIWLAQRDGRAPEMADRLFRAHFTDGLDVGDAAVLAKLAAEVGVDDTGEGAPEVRAEIDRARELGIGGVPLFLFEDKYAVSGAQPVDLLVGALREVEEREPLSVPQGDACADGYCLI
ncbi:DsbA family oxidoreductase [Herbidospora sp. NEAU-GS84]|uniref:DsbA family oxidoreductase n=1 Tax=Herbidospora solisilvae TaxID=2696284 RepID=A0A7C9J1Q4_9ACTN|nr:DsbA family oxidoreductase [Herbidospora solisilvae]NAS21725.1 DsbA family oxidoreductase [Herbidospora solisilvae]